MITGHRRAHRRIHALLWPIVFILVATAITTRRPLDAPADWPAFLAQSEAEHAPASAASGSGKTRPTGPLWTRDDAFGAWPARLALFADGTVELRPRRPLDHPELLLYWVPGAFAGDALPEDARLLGLLTGTHAQRFALPAKAGSLVLYALGHGAIVASARLDEPATDSMGSTAAPTATTAASAAPAADPTAP
ncbi:MAG: hypothetical protein U0900_05310 [Myxococcota bacterium]